ncbi:MAG TPA: group II intron reverse transcriptase/maturase, partial [Polyangiaceae bacterium]|nr:group II intron reverse transcriptase/maturase [Polyangiaceae bacterium]
MKRVADWCRGHLHDDVRAQQQALARKLRGHYQYFGITGNFAALSRFLTEVKRVWQRWLDRRSQKARMSWDRMQRLLERHPLPAPRIAHP